MHATTSVNTYYNVTYLDHPTLNGNPYGRPIVTHVWNPPGHAANYHNEVTGLFYDSNRKQWAIYNEDWTTMATGRTFNVIAASAADAWVGLWPTSEAPTTNDDEREVLFAHVYANPFNETNRRFRLLRGSGRLRKGGVEVEAA